MGIGTIRVGRSPIGSLSDVYTSSETGSDVLAYDSIIGSWVNKDPTDIITEQMSHADLSDMPDSGGTNTDHDTRYYTETELDSGQLDSLYLNLDGESINITNGTFNMTTTGTIDCGAITVTGTVTCDGLTMDANENITLGGQTLDYDGTGFVFSDSINTGANNIKTTGDIIGETKTTELVVFNPNAAWDIDTQIPVMLAKEDLTVTKIQVSLNTTAQEVAGDLKWANNLTSFTGATVINDFDTTSGVRTDSSISAGSVVAGKWMYIQFDSQPNAAITFMILHIEWDYD